MSEAQATDFLVRLRFGAWETVRCSLCGTIAKHYWRPADRRWQCEGCQNHFSVTSGTVFAYRKKPLQKLIEAALLWVNSAGGQAALELKRHLNVTYNTAYVWEQKFREGLVRGFNTGLLNGDLEIDGAHQSGRRSVERRGKPQGSGPTAADAPAEVDEKALTTSAQTQERDKRKRRKKSGEAAPVERDPMYNFALPTDRRIIITVRKRSGKRGYGAVGTRVIVSSNENRPAVNSVVRQFTAYGESILNTDNFPPYSRMDRIFTEHRQVVHSVSLRGPNGENNNLVEEINFRYDREERGTHLNIEPKYLLEYAVEAAFRADTRRLSNGDQLRRILHLTGSIGRSQFWIGYTQGLHRDDELSKPHRKKAKPSGPEKRWDPRINHRPPR
ncbi:MAG TPA: transposase [Steroidobacteraceae bacterium]